MTNKTNNAKTPKNARSTPTHRQYLGRVGVEAAVVALALAALDLDLVARLLEKRGHLLAQDRVHNVQEAHAVAQELLADALAGRVDGDLNVGARIHERGDKEAHGDGLAEAPRRRDEDLLVDRGPAVELEQPRVALRKEPRRVRLEEDAHDGVDEALVEEPLVVRALPPAAVQRHERLPQLFQAREAVAPRLRGVRRAVFEERVEPPEALANVLARHGGARRELLRGLPARPG